MEIEIEPSDIERAMEESTGFADALETFEDIFDTEFDDATDETAMEKYFEAIENQGEIVIEELVNEMMSYLEIEPTTKLSEVIKRVLDSIEVTPETREILSDIVEGREISPENKTTLLEELNRQSTEIETQIDTDTTLSENDRQAVSTTDQLAKTALKNMVEKSPPTEGGWMDILKKFAKVLLSLTGFLTIVFAGLIGLKVAGVGLTGCYQYYDKTKKRKLEKVDNWNYDDKNHGIYCKCLIKEANCPDADNLTIEDTTYEQIREICELTGEERLCLYDSKYKYNPICTLANGTYANAEPLVCKKDRSVYYAYEIWDWGSLLASIISGWPELFKGTEKGFERILKSILIFLVLFLSVVIIFRISKVIFQVADNRITKII